MEYAASVQKSVRKLDPAVRKRLRAFLEDRLAKLDNPRQLGIAMQGSRYGDLWRYRVGDYRILTRIDDGTIRILVIRIAHRRDIYQ
ncbi:MAG: type II toxin-antitoxin system RelE/ParE family toxin [Gemmatimonadales bacterium]|nr:type II toxin-antitoxin system RelE/ParE family toxin [Gemmatimonadales bacterium]MYG49112.1 type II toxin-antitoxin system RelE/ParE family toxin [Gemmatimonadales bacterium]MYK01270.1 type II toxin-antitoxin system RelE/ParE family toxin [Candidatus Palauibacter ramosifaciens]